MRALQRFCGWVAFGCLMLTIAIVCLFANPTILFAHKYEAGGLTLYADRAQNEAAAETLLASVSDALASSPLGAPERDYSLYSSRAAWRAALFFAPVPKAGGVVYLPFAPRHAFLTGVDPTSDRLLKGSAIIEPPRTLSFYMIHELTHLRMHEMLGTVGFYRMPHWVREGLPDYVALGPVRQQDMKKIIGWTGNRFDLIRQHGAYPLERAAVTYAIEHLGFSPIELMSVRKDFADILGEIRLSKIGERFKWL